MATVYISEFKNVGSFGLNGSDLVQVAGQPANASQTVSIAASSTLSSAFAQGTQMVRVHTDSTCSVRFVTGAGSASTADARMATNQTEYFTVPLNQSYKLAVIVNT